MKRGQSIKLARTIYASRHILKRTEYFESSEEHVTPLSGYMIDYVLVFSAGFAEEGCGPGPIENPPGVESDNLATNEFEDSDDSDDGGESESPSAEEDALQPHLTVSLESSIATVTEDVEEVIGTEDARNVRAKLSHPSSPRSTHSPSIPSPNVTKYPPKRKIFVKDFSYATYFAVLYYVSPNRPILPCELSI